MPTNNTAGDQSASLSSCRSKIAAMGKQLQALNEKLIAVQLQEYDHADLSVRLDYFEQINQTFDQAQCVLEDSETGVEEDGRMQFVSLYLDVKSRLTRQLNVICNRDQQRSSTIRQFSIEQSPSDNAAPTVHKTRLPEIQLPKFGGSYQDWPNFFGLFSTVIHDNCDLSELEKLHYLRTSLCDAALDTISSLELSASNYEEALKLLKRRFDNKLLNFQGHVKEIFELKAVERGSAGALRHLSDKLNSHLRAMQTKEQMADGFHLYLVATKFQVGGNEVGLSNSDEVGRGFVIKRIANLEIYG